MLWRNPYHIFNHLTKEIIIDLILRKRNGLFKTNFAYGNTEFNNKITIIHNYGRQTNIKLLLSLCAKQTQVSHYYHRTHTRIFNQHSSFRFSPFHWLTVPKVTSKILEPFEQYLEHTYNPHLDSMNRFNFALLSYVRDLFNFTWVISTKFLPLFSIKIY